MTIDDLIKDAHQIAVDKGWWQKDRTFAEQIALMHLTAENLIETDKPEGIAAELADVLIRIFDTCGRYEIPLEEALRVKMAYNKTRPYRHGNKQA